MNPGDTAWVLGCTALVLLMTPGLAFFYGGLVRERHVINTIQMSFIALAVGALVWAILGYSLAFASGSSWIGGLGYAFLAGVGTAPNPDYGATVPHAAFMSFQMMFAIITPALISGALVGRMKFTTYVAFIAAWSLLVYAPLAHWVWGPGGWIAELGALDFAGGTVVHVSSGVSALVAAWILGPRVLPNDRSDRKPKGTETPHNIPFVVLGAALLWFGWFGFNAGSSLAADGIAAVALTTTMLAGAASTVTWMLIELVRKGVPTATGCSIAAVVGLVAVTPAAGFVSPMSAIAIGAIASTVCYAAVQISARWHLDDTLDVFACHGIGGIVGALLTGVFASTAIHPGGADGLLRGNAALVGVQLVAVLGAAAFAAAGTAVILVALRSLMGLRTSVDTESRGTTAAEHSEAPYVLVRMTVARENGHDNGLERTNGSPAKTTTLLRSEPIR